MMIRFGTEFENSCYLCFLKNAFFLGGGGGGGRRNFITFKTAFFIAAAVSRGLFCRRLFTLLATSSKITEGHPKTACKSKSLVTRWRGA